MSSLKQISIAFPAFAIVAFGWLLLPIEWIPLRGIGAFLLFVLGVACGIFGFFFGIGMYFRSGWRWLAASFVSAMSFGLVWRAYFIHRVY